MKNWLKKMDIIAISKMTGDMREMGLALKLKLNIAAIN